MHFDIITIFPKIFDSYFNESILKRAQQQKLVNIKIHDLRKFTEDKHRTVDDRPYGGGPGMILMIEPIYKALQSIPRKKNSKIILLSAKGKRLNQSRTQTFSKLDQIIMIAGRYEGVDERVTNLIDEELSIGDYVLTGGEVPAMVLVDAITRLIPGVLGKDASSLDESFSQKNVLEYPQYTRPEKFKDWSVPRVLLSGNHQRIKRWRHKHRKSSL